ncbi:hypothetical protein D9M69_412260 [compost metagenome]
MIRASGGKSLHSSRPASGTPFIAARLAARMMSSRSPGVTTSTPGLSNCTVLATARAHSTMLSMRRCSYSPALITRAPSRSATSRTRGAFSSACQGTQPSRRKASVRSSGDSSRRRSAKASTPLASRTLLTITPSTLGSCGPPNSWAWISMRSASSPNGSSSGAETRITSASRLLARWKLTRAA